jgi:hypothetical protein
MKKAIEFYNNTTPKERVDFLNLIAKDLSIAVEIEAYGITQGGMHCLDLDDELPICINGGMIQLNVEPLINLDE